MNYEEVDFAICKPAWIKDNYHWSGTLLEMGKFAEKPITYHACAVKVFNSYGNRVHLGMPMNTGHPSGHVRAMMGTTFSSIVPEDSGSDLREPCKSTKSKCWRTSISLMPGGSNRASGKR